MGTSTTSLTSTSNLFTRSSSFPALRGFVVGIREDGVIPIAVISLRAVGLENINPGAIHHGLLPETHFGRRPWCFVGALYSQVDRKRRKFIRAQCKIKRLPGIINSVIPFSRSIHFTVGRLNHPVTLQHPVQLRSWKNWREIYFDAVMNLRVLFKSKHSDSPKNILGILQNVII